MTDVRCTVCGLGPEHVDEELVPYRVTLWVHPLCEDGERAEQARSRAENALRQQRLGERVLLIGVALNVVAMIGDLWVGYPIWFVTNLVGFVICLVALRIGRSRRKALERKA